jgi:hypothetical protein
MCRLRFSQVDGVAEGSIDGEEAHLAVFLDVRLGTERKELAAFFAFSLGAS